MGKINRQLLNKCECCGALFQGDDCEYCRARYNFYEEENKEHEINVISTTHNDILGSKITLRFKDKEIDFYASEVQWEPFEYGSTPIMRVSLISYGEMRDINNGRVGKDKRSGKSSK